MINKYRGTGWSKFVTVKYTPTNEKGGHHEIEIDDQTPGQISFTKVCFRRVNGNESSAIQFNISTTGKSKRRQSSSFAIPECMAEQFINALIKPTV